MDNTLHSNSPALAEGFKAIIKAVRDGKTPDALRILFRKRDNSLRMMDVAFDRSVLATIRGPVSPAVAKRNATNESRANLVVRERLSDGSFQWRTVPCSRVLSVSPIF